ncbi:MAG: hypothetical protein V1703_04345 [Candidatus Altiarchaeota archaeon]
MDAFERLKKGFLFLAVLFGIHFSFGLYAAYFNGFFMFGATAPERYLVYILSGSETTFNPTGSVGYHLNDLCLQKCDECNSLCFNYYKLEIDCDSCSIKTERGEVIVAGGGFFRAVSNRMSVLENVTFRCYRENTTECGFEEKLTGNYTLLHVMYTEAPSMFPNLSARQFNARTS